MTLPRIQIFGTNEAFRRELNSLDQEQDSELYYRGLLNLGRRMVQRDQLPEALRLFHFVESHTDSQPKLQRLAKEEGDALQGHGAFGRRFEFLSGKFLKESASPTALAGMAGAQAVFGLARAGLLLRLSTSPTANLMTRGFGAKALASTGAFALEAPSFVAFTHAANTVMGETTNPDPFTLGQELASSFLTLGALKFAGWMGGALQGRVLGLRGAGLQGAFSQVSMLGGIFLAQRFEELAHLRPASDSASSALDAFALLLQFNVAGRLLQAGMGPRWANFHQELRARSEKLASPLRNRPILGFENAAFATGAASTARIQDSHILQMQRADEIVAQAPASVHGLMESIKKITPNPHRPHASEDSRLLHETATTLLLKKPESLSPEEKKFLIAIGNHVLDQFQKSGDRYYLAKRIFWALDHFPGLQRVSHVLEKDSYDRYLCLLKLEDYERAFQAYDLLTQQMNFSYNAMDDLYGEALGGIYAHLNRFIQSRGYKMPARFSLAQTSGNLATLAPSYDLMISIAKGGLFSGGVADFMGLPVRVIEIHAHNRKNPTTRYIDALEPEDIAGKRVLLLDKDLVTGATLREAFRRLKPHKPASLGVYFNYNLQPAEVTQGLKDLGITLHFPGEIARPPTLTFFIYAHEKLGTALGRFRQALRRFDSLKDEPIVRDFLDRQEKVFFAFNPGLPGVSAVRATMASRLEVLLRNYWDSAAVNEPLARQHLKLLMKMNPRLPTGYVADLANGRYQAQAQESADSRGVKNIHAPHSYLAAFRSAQKAVQDKYDLALIVGPEGFAYEPIFRDLGMETVAVNIPEADFGGKRSIATFEDLGKLRGKKVLVIEDDVRSGATLQKLLEEIQIYQPRYLGLYLGLPAIRQMTENIPKAFKKTYITREPTERDEAAFLRHLKKREVVFKGPLPKP